MLEFFAHWAVAILLMPVVTGWAVPAGTLPAIVNEFSQGENGMKEWFEILVVEPNLDLRGWSAGDFDNGSFHPLIQFPDIPFWASIPAGTLIVIYNGGDPDPSVLIAGAPDTDNSNFSLVLDGLDSSLLLEVGSWPGQGHFGNSNTDDTPALRNAQGELIHNLAGRPDTPYIPSPGGGRAVRFLGGAEDDLSDPKNWRYTYATEASPGVANSPENNAWIIALRAGGVDVPPLLYPLGEHTVREGYPFWLTVQAQATDGDPVTLTASNIPSGATFDVLDAAGVFAWPEAGPIGVYTTRYYAADKDGVTIVESVINVVTNPLEAHFPEDWLWMREDTAPVTGRLEVVVNKPGDGVLQVAVSGTASVPDDLEIFPTTLTFTANGPTSQWINVVVYPDNEIEGPEWLDLELVPVAGIVVTSPVSAHVRILDGNSFSIAAANLSSQVSVCYPEYVGASRRLLRGMSPDVIAIQEFKAPDMEAYSNLVEEIFGPGWYVTAESMNAGCDLPNGIISRWPILDAGEWDDLELADRDFAWATIDLPGTQKLHVVSVHLKASDSGTDRARREHQARQITNYVAQMGWPESDFVVVAGDLNQASRNESALAVLTNVFSDAMQPSDQLGNRNTNIPRGRPYDYVLPNAPLAALHRPLPFGGFIFSGGMIFDSRVWNPPPAPVLPNDSAAIGVQHLGVLKLFALPGAGDSDMDGDGLPDSWELDYFDTLEVLNSIYDFDGDGLSDYGEYVAGTDPTDPDSLFQLSRFEPQEGAQIEIVWPSASNRQYSVWYSDDTLYNFQLAISNILATPPINTLQLNLSSPASARFYRIEVQWP